METPRTRYARSGDAHIAYQVFGEGELDLVVVPGFVSNIEHYWQVPGIPPLLERLASYARTVPAFTLESASSLKTISAGSQ